MRDFAITLHAPTDSYVSSVDIQYMLRSHYELVYNQQQVDCGSYHTLHQNPTSLHRQGLLPMVDNW